jgi:hypothetical protein
LPKCFIVRDASGQALGYFYFDEEAHRRAVNNQAADYGTSLGSPCSD